MYSVNRERLETLRRPEARWRCCSDCGAEEAAHAACFAWRFLALFADRVQGLDPDWLPRLAPARALEALAPRDAQRFAEDCAERIRLGNAA